MAWSAPMTAVINNVWTSAQWNTYVRDNMLETAAAKAATAGGYFVATGANAIAQRTSGGAVVATAQTTTSATYTDLATTGPSVTATTGTQALVFLQAAMSIDVNESWVGCSFAVSGATTISAGNSWAVSLDGVPANNTVRRGVSRLVTGLTAGSNTFTMKYKVATAGNTGTFQYRELIVIPL